jgi:hypothetical protein
LHTSGSEYELCGVRLLTFPQTGPEFLLFLFNEYRLWILLAQTVDPPGPDCGSSCPRLWILLAQTVDPPGPDCGSSWPRLWYLLLRGNLFSTGWELLQLGVWKEGSRDRDQNTGAGIPKRRYAK